ncbi:DUF7845 domain-containing protein [Haladaptatus sp. CMSO5]|uniref:DUF7845 domain-containing protein n=1 Tax=Haladaptatus sp. CMSO5 TaxID=3120514 RepID=UPI002FCE2A00
MADIRREDQDAETQEEYLFGGNYKTNERSEQPSLPIAAAGQMACRFCHEEYQGIAADSNHTCEERENRRLRTDFSTIRPATHELKSWLLFLDDPDDPYYATTPSEAKLSAYFALTNTALDTILNENVVFTHQGELWRVNDDENQPRYWEGGIAGRDQDVFDRFMEFKFRLEAAETPERGLTITVSPRFPDARHHKDETKSLGFPAEIPPGVALQAQSANVDPDEYVPLLQAFADVVDVNPKYFSEERLADQVENNDGETTSYCNTWALARYVRLDRFATRTLTGHEGVFHDLAKASMQNRGRGSFKWDGEKAEGYNDRVVLSGQDWGRLITGHEWTARAKVYHPRKVRSEFTALDGDDPLAHQKLEINYAKLSGDGNIPWHALDDVIREFDEKLLAVLSEAGLPTHAHADTFIEDHHFKRTEHDPDILVPDLGLDTVKAVEQQVARDTLLSANLGEKELSVARMMADGGRGAVEVAKEAGCSTSTVYRTISKLGDAADTFGNVVGYVDEYIRSEVSSLFQSLERTARYTERRLSEVAAEAEAFANDTAMGRWVRAHGVKLVERYNQTTLELSGALTRADVQRIMREGYAAAKRTGSKAVLTLTDALVRWHNPDGDLRNSRPFSVLSNSVLTLFGARIGPAP